MSKDITDAIDRAFGLTPEVRAKLSDIVTELYPNRSQRTLANITARADNMYVRDDWELTRRFIADLATLEPVLTRRVPEVADVLAYRESQRKEKGLTFTAEDKMSAFRTATAMTDEDRLSEVPADWKIAPVKKETPVATPMHQTDQLDRLVLERFGKTKFEISAVDRRRYHDALRPELTKGNVLAERTIENAKAQESAGRQLDPAQRIAKHRAEAALKATG